MDFFKFDDPEQIEMFSGKSITGWKSAMWVERYAEAGEFKLEGPLSSGMREFLPLGQLISHVNSLDVMIVENHQITEDENDPQIIITGRSLDTWLENRQVGVNLVRSGGLVDEYSLSAAVIAAQIVTLINEHITMLAHDSADILGSIILAHTHITTGTSEARTIGRRNLYSAVQELLKTDDLGLRVIRPNTINFDPSHSDDNPYFRIHSGNNKTADVQFSWAGGDFDKIEYLFTQKSHKTSAMVVGRYVWAMQDNAGTGYDRRMMLVDASDLDGHLTAAPAGGALTTMVNKMKTRGRAALKAQQRIQISSNDVSNLERWKYRHDYDIGDLVTLDGSYGNIVTVRVTEYAEIEDENGRSGHPTLAIPGT